MPSFKLPALMGSLVFMLNCVASPAWAEDTSTSYNTKDLNEQLVMATLWVQASGEYRALAYQAFNMGKMSLDSYMASHPKTKKVAVIVDADETVLDNGAYEAWLIGKDFGYSSKTWGQWMDAGEAVAVPGATDFLNYAAKKGAEVFYITNRKESGRAGTLKNMKALGFPFADDEHLLMKSTTSDKEPRRIQVAENYGVALLMGDNLNDFSADFNTKTLDQTYAAVEKDKALFGTQFIVLPNPEYGDWEGKVYDGNWGASAAEKDAMRKAHLNVWKPME